MSSESELKDIVVDVQERLREKRVGVLMGGLSEERDVSLRSGKNVHNALLKSGINVVPIDLNRDTIKDINRDLVDYIYVILHGRYGEDGIVQGFLELQGIPYTGSGVLASALAMNKLATKRFLVAENIPTTPFDYIRSTDDKKAILEKLYSIGFPVIFKPFDSGSSIGVVIVKDEKHFYTMVEEYKSKYPSFLVEKYISGTEITVGVIEVRGNIIALPILEIAPKNEFYDYEAKYTKGMTDFYIPARIPQRSYDSAILLAKETFSALGCSGVARIDAMVDNDGNVFIFEVNTLPGMTETSDLPMQAKAYGISFEELVLLILDSAISKDM